jgi:hypothetical protein
MSEQADMQAQSHDGELKEAAGAYHADLPEIPYPLRTSEDRGWEEFRDQCRRQMRRPMALRLRYGFARRSRSDASEDSIRAFRSMAEYRAWCEAHYPSYYGMKRPGT